MARRGILLLDVRLCLGINVIALDELDGRVEMR